MFCRPLRRLALSFVLTLGLGVGSGVSAADAPNASALRLHPDNPHYFLFRGKPTILLTSGEHYGAVLNADFNFRQYLFTLANDGLNLTRLFTGAAYVEPPGAFNIERNTLAPASGRYLAPWARSKTPGYAGGGNKFDLEKWNEDYFARLREFVNAASRNGVVVEVNLFCPFYEDTQWRLSPFHPDNNVNGAGKDVARTNVYTTDRHGGLWKYQERVVRKLVAELKDDDHVYFEICNEPYFGGVTLAWQREVARVIQDAQRGHAKPKLISQNIANGNQVVEERDPAVSIFNFHYANPPTAVAENYALNAVIGDNETGFKGTNNAPYRIEAWDFLLAGGGLFNHLDYSFTVGHEDGTFPYPKSQPGGGNAEFRKQLGYLRTFLQGLDFLRLKPDTESLHATTLPESLSVRLLSNPGQQYALYLRGRDLEHLPSFPADRISVAIQLPAGKYTARWVDTKTGATAREEGFQHSFGPKHLTAPAFQEDLALVVLRRP